MLPGLGVEAVGTGVAAVVGIADISVAKTELGTWPTRKYKEPPTTTSRRHEWPYPQRVLDGLGVEAVVTGVAAVVGIADMTVAKKRQKTSGIRTTKPA